MKPVNWIVMPVWNCHHLTRDAIASCLAQDLPGVRVLAVIDHGTDGVAQYLRSLHPRVQVVEAPGCGVSKAWNLALGHVFDRLGRGAALVVNSDVKLRADTYRRLLSDGGHFVTCVGTSSGAKFPGGEPDANKKRPHPDFSCFLLTRYCWEQVGKFDDSMRIYTSDGDYHLRMHHAGIEAYCLDLPFYHYASGTLKQADPDDRDRLLAQAGRDREAFTRKWGFEMGSDEYYAEFKTEAPAASDPEPRVEL